MNDYIKTMRNLIGNETLLTIGCGAIIEDDQGRILLIKRKDYEEWGIPGGILELGETFEQTVKREVFEETKLHLQTISLFGIYSGKNGYATYENGDKVYSVQIIFHTKDFEGNPSINEEATDLAFFARNEIPENLNSHQAKFIEDWVKETPLPVIE